MLIIIHGWSDHAASFKPLARKLAKPVPEGIGADVRHIDLGDYLTLDDQVGFDDLVEAMQRAWQDKALPTTPRAVDVVVHSTAGLIIRHWLCHYYRPTTAPIKRLLMLAPANFGSPLAHTGRSLIGRAVKGWKGTRLFETGSKILRGLELASPYAWQLAERDLLSPDPYYAPGRILCTVLTGNSGYRGISALANKPGSDGTVRVASANLNIVSLELDFSRGASAVLQSYVQHSSACAFGIADREDHSSIAAKNRGPRRAANWQLICQALTLKDDDFSAWQQQLALHNEQVSQAAERRRGQHHDRYQNTLIRVIDNHGNAVCDYVIELYFNNDQGSRNRRVTQLLQERVISSVHAWSDDKSYRSFLINCSELNKILERADDRLNISITAAPELADGMVGYKTYSDEDIGALSLGRQQVAELFDGHRTVLITIRLQRYQRDGVFRFKTL